MSRSHWLLIVLIVLSLVTAQDDQPYCSIRYQRLCQGKGTHVGCQFPDRGSGPTCENYTSIIFTNELKSFILNYVNRRRQRIASGHERVRGGIHLPKPKIMMFVEWDRELAYLAQRLADQCRFIHDDCRATVRYPYAGQTVGEVRWRRSGESVELGARRSIGRVLDAWWGERRRVLPKQLITPFKLTPRGAVWGHFSQLAVWTLRAMGCGAVQHGVAHPRLLLICDFSHTNMLGQLTISPGPLAQCPSHTMRMKSSHYPLLCAPFRERMHTEAIESYRDDEEYDSETNDAEALNTPKLWHASTLTSEIEDPEELSSSSEAWSSRSSRTVARTEVSIRFREPEDGFQVKLNKELSMRKAAYKGLGVGLLEGERRTRRPYTSSYVGYWGDDNEVSEEIPMRERTMVAIMPKSSKPNRRQSRPTVYYTVTEETGHRRRWQQFKHRSKRPGHNALLHYTPVLKFSKILSASLNMDQEDVEQLFRDTGFKINIPDK